MTTRITLASLSLLVPLLFSSCREDPELIKKQGQQEAELAELRGELALIEERLKNVPDDRSAELKAALEESSKLETELKQLESEVTSLEAERKKLEEEYKAYQRKYVAR